MNILYEDNHVIVAIKPQNMPTQSDSSGDADFLNAIKEYVRVKYQKPGQAYIGLVHRLDRPAGGVVVFARTSKAAARLAQQMKQGDLHKVYNAIVTASLPEKGELEHYLLKDTANNIVSIVPAHTKGAKKAVLFYHILAQKEGNTLLSVDLITGRPHQIRVQFSGMGAPLLGDRKYGGDQNAYLCLWARTLSFLHPTTKQRLTFVAPLPRYYPFSIFR